VAGRRNQGHLAALQLLRERARGQDEAIRAWQESVDAVTAIDVELEELRSRYEAKTAALRAERAAAAQQSDERLGAVAVLIGDGQETARLLGVAPDHVARASARERAPRLRPGAGAPKDNTK